MPFMADTYRMRTCDYDVVIVGARCAGATLAIFLARAGANVLLLDKEGMPSDHILSTHMIAPPGIDVLDEVGVGEAVRAVTPATRIIRMCVDGASIDFELPDGRAGYCPRRKRLDGLLQRAAVSAGAQLLDRTRVTSLVQEEGRVRGVLAIRGNQEQVFTAGLVVGADGRYSTVAKLVEAEEYLGYDGPRATYWAYWNAPSFWKADPEYRFDMYVSHVGGDIRALFQTDHDQLLIAGSPSTDQTRRWRANPQRELQAALGHDPVLGPLIRESRPDGMVRGTVKERYFFRRAAGNGWVLVGDAGHHKEFVLGDGITEALLQARGLAAAITEGTDAALTRWWRARDVAALPLFFFGKEAGAAGSPAELRRDLISHLTTLPDLNARIVALMERQLSPFEALPISCILRWTWGAALRGRWGALGELLGAGGRAAAVHRELSARVKLLAEAEAIEALARRAA